MCGCIIKWFYGVYSGWGNPVGFVALLCERYKSFGGRKKGLLLGRSTVMGVFWVI
jgi:hypothetical protein